MRLVEELESLLEDGPQNSRFDIELTSTVRELHQEWGRSPEEIRTEILDSELEHPLINFLIGLSRWMENCDYHGGAKPALEDLREALDLVIEEEWYDLFPILIVQRIELLSDLNHRNELEAEVNLGLCFLMEEEGSIAIGPVFDILTAITDNLKSISGTPTVEVLTDYLRDHAEKAITAGNYRNHRKLWRRNLEVREGEDLERESAIDAIIKSYNDEITALKSSEEHSIRATVAKEAIIECDKWVDQVQRVEWEREFIDGNKMSIEQMAEIMHEPSEEEIEELDDELEGFIERFREQKEERHAIFAIKWLLNQSIFVPDVEEARKISEGSIMEHFHQRTISQAGEFWMRGKGFEPSNPYGSGS